MSHDRLIFSYLSTEGATTLRRTRRSNSGDGGIISYAVQRCARGAGLLEMKLVCFSKIENGVLGRDVHCCARKTSRLEGQTK